MHALQWNVDVNLIYNIAHRCQSLKMKCAITLKIHETRDNAEKHLQQAAAIGTQTEYSTVISLQD